MIDYAELSKWEVKLKRKLPVVSASVAPQPVQSVVLGKPDNSEHNKNDPDK